MYKGLTEKEFFDKFSKRAQYVGDLHTIDGVKSLYSIVARNGVLYADDTYALRLAYEKTFYKKDGLYYADEEHYLESKGS